MNPRARRISLRLCAQSRSLKLTLPPRASRAAALDFVARQRPWIEAQMARRLPPPAPFVPGARVPFGDGWLTLSPGSGRVVVRDGERLCVPGGPHLFAGRTQRWLVAQAQAILEAETRALAARLGRPVRQVRIGDFRSRWGSCAPDGRIAYSWRLILAPDGVRASVVAHEVAHLLEPNHGPAFWALADHLLGQSHRPARRWLAANGPMLHAIGATT